MPPESDAMTVASKRPEYRNINAFRDVPTYRLPAAALVSILHRISGVLMFALLPFVMWLFDKSLSSEISFASFRAAFTAGLWIFPAFVVKLVVLALIWAFLHHLFAGVRHVWTDMSHAAVTKEAGSKSAQAVLIASVLLTVALGAKLFGVY
jgi:succinate dehydrogenase / fumarate reductase cytochrome b subunit